MPHKCCIHNCRSNYDKVVGEVALEGNKRKYIPSFQFPDREKQPHLWDTWFKYTTKVYNQWGTKEDFLNRYARSKGRPHVCIKHFVPEDIEIPKKSTATATGTERKELKKDPPAVPRVFTSFEDPTKMITLDAPKFRKDPERRREEARKKEREREAALEAERKAEQREKDRERRLEALRAKAEAAQERRRLELAQAEALRAEPADRISYNPWPLFVQQASAIASLFEGWGGETTDDYMSLYCMVTVTVISGRGAPMRLNMLGGYLVVHKTSRYESFALKQGHNAPYPLTREPLFSPTPFLLCALGQGYVTRWSQLRELLATVQAAAKDTTLVPPAFVVLTDPLVPAPTVQRQLNTVQSDGAADA